jgi:Ca-activated chloride channel family protein
VVDELMLRPRRLTEDGRREYARGNHPEALRAFEGAAGARPADPRGRFNLADALYKTGRYDEAAELFRSLGEQAGGLAAPARFNLGNTLFQKQDYRGAVQAYRDSLRLAPGEEDARRNLELALRALREQQEKEKRDPQKQEQKQQDQQKGGQKDQQQQQQQQQQGGKPKPQTPEEREEQRFRQETGMPRDRAMQLLDALQQNEKAEQKKKLEAQRAQKKGTKDW